MKALGMRQDKGAVEGRREYRDQDPPPPCSFFFFFFVKRKPGRGEVTARVPINI